MGEAVCRLRASDSLLRRKQMMRHRFCDLLHFANAGCTIGKMAVRQNRVAHQFSPRSSCAKRHPASYGSASLKLSLGMRRDGAPPRHESSRKLRMNLGQFTSKMRLRRSRQVGCAKRTAKHIHRPMVAAKAVARVVPQGHAPKRRTASPIFVACAAGVSCSA